MSINDFSGLGCLEFLKESDLRILVCYEPSVVQIASGTIRKLGSILPHWYIAPTAGEKLSLGYLRDLHATFQVLRLQQENGCSKIIFVGEQRIDLYQTSFGLPSRLSFTPYEIETHYSRSMKRINQKTTEI